MDEETLRKYLLGDVLPEEEDAVETWLMSDDKAYDLLAAAEDDLVDASLAGRLGPHELDRFQSHFLAAPERQRRLQFARALNRPIAEVNPAVVPEFSTSTGFWGGIVAFLNARPVLGYAAAALIGLILIGGIGAGVRVQQLQRRLDSTANRLAAAAHEREELRRQFGESQALDARLQAQFETLEQTVKDLRMLPGPTLLAFNLMPGVSRSAADIQEVTVAPGAGLLEFSLLLLDDDYPTYRVSLLEDVGRELWTRDRLPSTVTRNGEAVVLTVPGALLAGRDYSFSLSGLPDAHPPEKINSYSFRVVRQ